MSSYIKEHKRQALALALVFFLSVFAGIFIQSHFFHKNQGMAEAETAAPEDKVINFLLLGVDERDDDVGRSDTILVLSFNPSTKRAELISVPRDSRVTIPGYGKTKINHSFAYGGARMTKQMVEKTLGIHIDNYFVFNFKGFRDTMDAIGGVDLDVDKDMYYRDDYDVDGGLLIDLKQGPQHLDSEKAMEYVRFRDGEGDIGRVKRQQKFLQAVSKKLLSPGTIPQIPSIIKSVYQSIDTDLAFDDCMKLAKVLIQGQSIDIQAMMVPGSPAMIDDLSYWIIDGKQLKSDLENVNAYLMDKTYLADKDSSEIQDKDDEGIFKDQQAIAEDVAKWEKDPVRKSKKDLEKIKRAEMREREEEQAYREAVKSNDAENASFIDTPVYTQGIPPQQEEDDRPIITVINASGNDAKAKEITDALAAQGFRVSSTKSSTTSNTSSAVMPASQQGSSKQLHQAGLNVTPSYHQSDTGTIVLGKDISN